MTRLALFVGLCTVAAAPAVQAESPPSFQTVVQPFLKAHCLRCHGPDRQRGDVALDELTSVDADNAELWTRVWDQVALKEMPPKSATEQPTAIERVRVSQWITSELARAMKDKGGFHAHLHPAKGNYLDHDLLFGPIPDGLAPPSTPARLVRLHPQEHLVRLNALINREPEYDPERPGLRTRGDMIPPNEEGEVKVYFGLDRVIGWVGGTAAYAAAITGFPAVLSTTDDRGLRSYPIFYSVNGSEALQTARTAKDILRFMAYGPTAEPYQFADRVADIDKKYKHESLRGLSQSLFYGKSPKRPLTPVYDLMREPGVSDDHLRASVRFLFESLTGRPPTDAEATEYFDIARATIAKLGKEDGALLGLTPIFLDRDALFRPELAEAGTPDAHGRVMLQDQELALAVNAAFSYLPPDETLSEAARTGRMKTRADVEREVDRILADESIRKPRVLQFFREYFEYDRAGTVCKDAQALVRAGGNARTYYRSMVGMTAHTDRLIELILRDDKNVLAELLTTDRVVYDPAQDSDYFGEFVGRRVTLPEDVAKKRPKGSSPLIRPADLPKGEAIHTRVAQVVRPQRTGRTLTTLPAGQRLGILTHPSWLVAHSDATDNHAIHRGRWVRERLLGGAVPDVPITVDAMLPDEPNETLRHRMRVTRDDYCWKCHQKMDPLGLPFEMFNHIGLYRTEESGKTVDTTGAIIDSGDPALDGPVTDAVEMIRKLAQSERVEQVFVRHAFRFWIGRNETLEDAPVLQNAYRAYHESGGSMKAMLRSLLTSDAFLDRTVEGEESPPAGPSGTTTQSQP